MSTHSNIHSENPLALHGGRVWNRLHTEREEILAALLHDVSSHSVSGGIWSLDRCDTRTRERLQARLRKVDDALDRLIAGVYGDCCKCGRWIEDPKLDADPTLAYCTECEPASTRTDLKSHFTLDHPGAWRSYEERSAKWRP
jgi:hypothetical protein